ncbi:MAG TPA: N-methyl-L-tryptophan oxidase [Gemmatimonadaceae bacterium]
MKHFDVIVAGGGAMGSAAAWQLAKRGLRVACLDRFAPPHALGSSHGGTRIIREAYFEHPQYVPLVRRAYTLWDELAQGVATSPLYVLTGGAYIGPPNSTLLRGVHASVRAHAIAHDVLDPAALAQRYPALKAEFGMQAIIEQRAGFLHVAAGIRAMRAGAIAAGAQMKDFEPVERFDVGVKEVQVQTARGSYHAERLVIAAGGWIRELVPQLAGVFSVQRQVTVWCAALGPGVAAREAPVTIWELHSGETFYTIPDEGDGFKIGVHYGGALTTAADIQRTVSDAEQQKGRELLARYIPAAAGEVRSASVCMYTNTPDLHFAIDWLPGTTERVLIVSPCSGHGFKFAPAVGEVVAEMITTGHPAFDIGPFSLQRF